MRFWVFLSSLREMNQYEHQTILLQNYYSNINHVCRWHFICFRSYLSLFDSKYAWGIQTALRHTLWWLNKLATWQLLLSPEMKYLWPPLCSWLPFQVVPLRTSVSWHCNWPWSFCGKPPALKQNIHDPNMHAKLCTSIFLTGRSICSCPKADGVGFKKFYCSGN